ncbi:hypothetical protein EW146_g1410 [Bondarzewia mesenterica]|uniref:NmrA-like domain-containing protein n=1 Tax=Bondarzewia mesenterica TaxID=1095465 RepID=A0A4S4M3U7_9AGAM|nr:hypothetical protein EW146_g1410 [Bondarzewia mesenterica]
MAFKTFAVAGAGHIGAFIAEELVKQKAVGKANEVVVLTRLTSTNPATKKLAAEGAKVVAVDYTSKASLLSALAGIEVVICTFDPSNLAIQDALAEAAKEAGVQLFVPSEFGNPTEDANEGPLAAKKNFQGKLRALGLPYALFFTGPFSDYCFIPFLGLDLVNGKVSVGGDGNALISWTSRRDIARYVAHVLTTLPNEKILGRTFRIEGERTSFNNIFKTYEAKTGKKLDITYRASSDLEAAVKSNPNDIGSLLHWAWSIGGGTVGKEEDITNGEFPDWNPLKVVEVLTL